MGMAAGQARLLSITSRMSDNELRAQIINNNKMRLAAESSQASETYVAALNEAQLMFTNYDINNNATYQNLTYNALTSFNPYNNQYALINSSGNVLLSERDAENYKASGGNLEAFLSRYGLDYTTTYFDNLQQHMTVDSNGKYSLSYLTEEFDADGNAITADITANANSAQELSDYLQMLYDGAINSAHIGYEASLSSGVYYDYMRYSTELTEAHGAYYEAVNELKEDQFKNLKVYNKNLEAYLSELSTLDDMAKIKNFIGTSGSGLLKYIDSYYNNCSDVGKTKVNDLKGQLAHCCDATVTTSSTKNIDSTGRISVTDSAGFIIDSSGNVSYYYKVSPKSITYNATKEETKDGVTKTVVDTGSGIVKYTDADGTSYNVGYTYDSTNKKCTATITNSTTNAAVKTITTDAAEDEDTARIAAYRKVSQHVKTGTEKTKSITPNSAGNYVIDVIGRVSSEDVATKTVTNDYKFGTEGDYTRYQISNVDTTNKTCTLGITCENSVSLAKQAVQKVLDTLKLNYQNWWADSIVNTSNAPDAFTVAKENYDNIGKKFANFLGLSVDFNDYMNMLDIDWVFEQFGNNTSSKDKFMPVKDVILLDIIMDTYGEPNYAWIDVSEPGATPSSYNTNGQSKAQWYENLFNRIKSGGYQVLQDGLASSPEWIQFAFESGIVTMEQVDTLKNWQPLIYSNCSDITSQTNEKMIAKAEAEYRNAMNKIENKDKRYDLELKNIDTEHNSLMTEYESIKTAIEKNVERTFKLYS